MALTFNGGDMKKRGRGILFSAIALVVLAVLSIVLSGSSPTTLLGLVMNTFLSARNPPGMLMSEVHESPITSSPVAVQAPTTPQADAQPPNIGTWSSYNGTLTSQRYSPLSEINTKNVNGLKVLCSYDTKLHEGFETGPIMVNGALIGTTVKDTFSIDPSTCRENWRTHEDYASLTPLTVNRGAAYLDGRLFRGTLDGRVLAYDFKTGKRLWETAIADPKTGELVDAAPIAWNGLVFIGISFGDVKGVKGRVYALAAQSGNIVWETYLVPKTGADVTRGPVGPMPAAAITTWKNAPDVPISGGGSWTSYTLDPVTGHLYVPVGNPSPDFVNDLRDGENLYTNSVLVLDANTGGYLNHFQIAPRDWHDWDMSNTPGLITTRGGRQLLSFAPKNGYLYGVDLATNSLLYRNPVTRVENAEEPLSTDKNTHFCPGTVGGAEWNGVAYDAPNNLILTGETEWCSKIKLVSNSKVKAVQNGTVWTGNEVVNPLDALGAQDPHQNWAGWLYATDADSGVWKWRLKSNYPFLGGITPTAGGLVFFGDIGGNFYAVDASNGKRLWTRKLEGAVGGGVITYIAGGSQKVAVAAGMTSFFWPTEQTTGKIVILGLN
jgi:alcohol dehydrogenase (cytochrome c)